MATETSIEAARTRIQRLVEEIAALSKADIASEEFFKKYIERVVAATDANGGAIWLLGTAKGEFQLCAETNFSSSRFQSDEAQRTAILKSLSQVVQNSHPAVLFPEDPASLTPQSHVNRTPFPFLHVPLFLKGKIFGILQVWLKPYVQQTNYGEFITFLISLAGYVEQHLQSRQLGNLVLETQRLQHMLRFLGDIAGTLDPVEVARLTANYSRDILNCERCSVLIRDGDRWSILAISGQETVEKKSALAKSMIAFVSAHQRDNLRILNKKELLADTSSDGGSEKKEQETQIEPSSSSSLSTTTKAIDKIDLAYFELSHVVSAVLAPLQDADKQVFGILFCESTTENFFGAQVAPGKPELPPPQALAQWLGIHAGRVLAAARDYSSLPLMQPMRKVREIKLAATGTQRSRLLLKALTVATVLCILALWPIKWQVDGNCTLVPEKRAQIVSEIPARVQSVTAREGQHVHKGDVLAQLDTRRLLADLEIAAQDKQRYLTESDRYRAAGDQGAAQVSLLQSKIAASNEEKLKAEIESATLRAPFDGIILTKDIEQRVGEFLQAGSVFAEIASFENWELQIEVPESDIGLVEAALDKYGAVNTDYILYTQSAQPLHTRLTSRQQISAAAYAKEKENVFLVTLHSPGIPPDLYSSLRPNLTGRAKLQLGRKPVFVVLGTKIVRWLRLKFLN